MCQLVLVNLAIFVASIVFGYLLTKCIQHR